MSSAFQATNSIVNAFHAGFEDLMNRRAEMAALERGNTEQQLGAWKQFAIRMQEENVRLQMSINLLQKDYAALKNNMMANHTGSSEYIDLLVKRIKKLDDALQRESANASAYQRMRDRLAQDILNCGDPNISSTLTEEQLLDAHQEAWHEFMGNTNVKMGVPMIGDKP